MSLDHATSERAYSALKADLLDGRLSNAKSINIAALTRRYAVSATPVREALLRLTGEGLVVMRQTGGFALPRWSVRRLEHLLLTETALLTLAITLLGARSNGPARFGVDAARYVNDCRRAASDQLMIRIARATGIRPLCDALMRLNGQLRHARNLAGSPGDVIVEETQILHDLLSRGDWEGAVNALDRRYQLERLHLGATLPAHRPSGPTG